ncbi:molybdenum cofactor guanylyltransferase [Qipengyuania soli]|uniref:NTP transferase domain-containing protein n=1 Tax=Qipengyuania soli TaxID=2782568 RepID=A0A7S8F3C4_9SPHN|nr:NTP transferase domain-containing protein [Qipengyuania soli]QPC98377.1 NTP transferase domain-containing protein [Qipengyuania soli]
MVLVLAGGDGRRIGGGKPLRKLAGQTLLDHALRMARRWSDGRTIVAGTRHDGGDHDDAVFVEDAGGMGGPLAGLAAGLLGAAQSGAETLLVIPVDAPFLPHDLCDRLRERLDTDASAACALAHSNGRDHPTCSLWQVAEAQAGVESVKAGKNHSLMRLAETVGCVRVEWPTGDEIDPFFNINSAEDLAIAGKMFDQS